ncbi:small ribosomal subunit Rsm22 family protein [Nocardia sp. CA2R105]|uniref:small ribosomal subunit Rsm22 family protein n=1 Tax=Nocardia coffeae TaxID=2873381 RepID=UPI001CA663C7|nr:small ribosomal subunit Rsm22 family protein [Nocardia coffeae]MBY8861190.1 small ribosomal subunit Rsm22 family protein [Nocardia coffeae]
MDLPVELVQGLERACAGVPERQLAVSVDRLISRYRDPRPAAAPILGSSADVTAYAAYRMPATWAAVRNALGRFHQLVPDFQPRSLLDIGGGTGAALWASASAFPSLTEAVVLDQVDEALQLGRRLAAGAAEAVVRSAVWRRGMVTDLRTPGRADLAAISYVLSELSDTDQAAVVVQASEAADVVLVIEPGTPDGHRRILAARESLMTAGLTIVAPCPHRMPCPLAEGSDWCHFSARINRTSLHRRLKGAELGHEDEKFSYVIASRTPHLQARGRILRHPLKRKGLVTLQVCTAEEGVVPTLVSKRQAETYRRARDVQWGDAWPPDSPGDS